jgi:hypothetical protein
MSIIMRKTGPIVAGVEIDGFEKRVKKTLPEDYRTFLSRFNGGRPSEHTVRSDVPGGVHIQLFYGLRSEDYFNLDYTREMMTSRWPERFLSIGCDSFGNEILLSLSPPDRGSVYFWNHEEEAEEGEEPYEDNLYLIADSFTRFWLCIEPVEPEQ